MVQDHFLQAAACRTFMVRYRHSARPIPRRGFGSPSTLLPKGGAWRTMPAHVPSPEVSLPGPFVLAPPPALPVALGWLHTSAESRRVRAGSSGRTRIRPGRLRLFCLSSFHRLTLSSNGILSPEPLRLTRPFRAYHLPSAGNPGLRPGLSYLGPSGLRKRATPRPFGPTETCAAGIHLPKRPGNDATLSR